MFLEFLTKCYNDFLLDFLFILSLIITQLASVALALIGYLRSRENTAKIAKVQSTLDDKVAVPEKVILPLDRLNTLE